GDLDGDGRPDVVFCNNNDKTISIYQNIVPFGGAPPTGAVAWWPAENNANDIVGTNNGIAQNTTYTNGEVGQAFVLNGSSSQVRVPASPGLNVGLGGGFSIEMWINPASISLQELCEWNQNSGSGADPIGALMEINENAGDGKLYGNIVDT